MLRIDDIHAFGVIGMRQCEELLNFFIKYDIINTPINKNLFNGGNFYEKNDRTSFNSNANVIFGRVRYHKSIPHKTCGT